jgi:cytochrome c oxidase subunit 2
MLSWLPENISTYGGDIDSLFALIYYVVGAWFIAAEGLLLYFIIRYRRREGTPAAYVRGASLRQLSWILVPAAIVLVLDLFIDYKGHPVWARVKQDFPADSLRIGGIAKQFNWAFTYPGRDGQLGTADDFTIDNELHVPIDQNVHIAVESQDVIHSFFIPVIRVKQDVLPGRTTNVWFNAGKTGRYELPCAELCGFGHYTMRGFLVVHSPEEYRQWIESRTPAA